MDKSRYFLNLSKCTEEQQKYIISLLPEHENPEARELYDISDDCYVLVYICTSDGWEWIVGIDDYKEQKTELTYPEFIKLFEGGEEENTGWIKIKESNDLPRQRGEFWFVSQLEKGKIVKAYFNPNSSIDGNKAHYVKLYSHYQPIIKPLPFYRKRKPSEVP